MSEECNIFIECLDLLEEDYYTWVSKENFERLRFLDNKNFNKECSKSELKELETLDLNIHRNTLRAWKAKKKRIESLDLKESDFYEYGFTTEDFKRLKYLQENSTPLLFSWRDIKELTSLKERLNKLLPHVLKCKEFKQNE